MFNGFASSHAEKSKYTDFLPFQNSKANRKVSKETAQILVELISAGRIPAKVTSAAMQMQEVRELLGV